MSQKQGQNIFNIIVVAIATITISGLFYIKLFNPEVLSSSKPTSQKQIKIEQNVIDKVLAGTVSVQGRSYNGNTLTNTSSGSGFFISEDGLIITNEHVINGCNLIIAVDCTGKSTKAEIVSSDKRLDIALLKIETEEKLDYLELGNSNILKHGQVVMAAGNPLNNGSDGRAVITLGRISKLNERCDSSPDFINDRLYDNLIQFDASVFPGSSGGPLVDSDGKVIGVVSAVSRNDNSGRTGFAISIDDHIKGAIETLNSGECIVHGFLGTILANEIPNDIINEYNLRDLSGAYVNSVLPGSPAVKSGIEQGDIIIKLSDHEIYNRSELISHINKSLPGSIVEIELLRPQYNGKLSKKNIRARIEKRTLDNRNGYFEEMNLPSSIAWGVTAKRLTNWRRQKNGFPAGKSGVLVYEIDRNSLAYKQGVKPGDIITGIDNAPVSNLSDFERLASKSVLSPRFNIWNTDLIPAHR